MTSSIQNRQYRGTLAATAALAALLLGAACGCSNRPRPITDQDMPGYRHMLEDVAEADTAPLRGRLIMLDPGHGGIFRGARSPQGLEEADVNLGVALYLRGLLEWAGARVVMTRTSDRDFLTAADSSLAGDLAFRVSLMDSLQPDVFVSLHHNSNPDFDPVINETQTYYPLGDSGPSLQLARAIHRHLAFNLGITPARIMPGNFHVLRNATVPAVLGEPAMISNPVIAGRLSLAASQRMEAEAYFLGLLDYFAQGAPEWISAQGDTLVLPGQGPVPELTWTFVPDHRGGVPDTLGAGLPGPDPASFRVVYDGQPQDFALDGAGRTVRWSPPGPTAEGTVTVSGRNLAGNRTPDCSLRLVPTICAAPAVFILREAADDHPMALVTWSFPERVTPASAAGSVSWPGGFSLSIDHRTRGARLVPADSLPASPDQGAWSRPGAVTARPCPLDGATLPAGWRLVPVRGLPQDIGGQPLSPAWRYRDSPTPPLPPEFRLPSGFAVVPVADPWLECDGLLPLRPGDASAPLEAQLLEPAVWGKTIVLDPRGGGIETDSAGPLGTRGADLNLAVARLAADMLKGTGARVILTRAAGRTPSDPDKVQLARDRAADLFLVVGRSTDDVPSLRHYPGSDTGSAWARAAADFLRRAGVSPDSCRVGSGSDYLLRHTHCPALVVELPGIATTTSELLQSDPFNQRCEAAALVLAVLGTLSGEGSAYPDATLPAILANLPGAQEDFDFALWDGNLGVVPAPAGTSGHGIGESLTSYRLMLPARRGRHQLELHKGERRQVWSLLGDSSGWQGRIVQAGP